MRGAVWRLEGFFKPRVGGTEKNQPTKETLWQQTACPMVARLSAPKDQGSGPLVSYVAKYLLQRITHGRICSVAMPHAARAF